MDKSNVGKPMLIDARHLEDQSILRSKVCIIGGGPAGITILREFARQGIETCLLEAGGTEADETQSLADGLNIGLPYFPLRRSRGLLWGGSSNLWFQDIGLRTRPLDAMDFEKRPWIPSSGWPFPGDTLTSYYNDARAILGLDAETVAVDDLEYTSGAKRLPLDESRVETKMFQFAPTTTFRDYLPDLEGAANVRIVLHSNVLEIGCSIGDRVEQLRVGTIAGTTFFVQADIFILACGGIENARLLLLSRSRYPQGVGNQHDLAGRFFMEHPHVATGHLVPLSDSFLPSIRLYEPMQIGSSKVLAALAISNQVQEREGLGNFSASMHRTSQASATSRSVRSLRSLWRAAREGRLSRRQSGQAFGHLRNVLMRPDQVGALMVRRILGTQEKTPGLFEFMVMSEQVPNPTSRVTLSSKRDRFGRPLPALEWRLTDQDIRTIRRSQDILDEALLEAGVGRIGAKFGEEEPPPLLSGGWHHIGTTRMHSDPRQGVVDANCKVHGMKNLYIAGSSLFPTAGYANPTLTIVALAVRLANHIQTKVGQVEAA